MRSCTEASLNSIENRKNGLLIRLLTTSFLIVCSFLTLAQNPIVPPGVYMADPTARVWEDGILYIYGSVDESPDYYCSYNYHVLSTNDLVHWTIHENRFSSKGSKDHVCIMMLYFLHLIAR